MAGHRQTRAGRKSALDHLQFTSQYVPVRRHYGEPPQAAAIDICLWDLLGKSTGLPVYQILGAYKDRVPAYASSQHLQTKTPDPYVEAALKAKAEGFRAFKINPPPVDADGDSHTGWIWRSARRCEKPWATTSC